LKLAGFVNAIKMNSYQETHVFDIENGKQTAAQLMIRSLVQQNVKHIFGIPGGKIMPTFDVFAR